MQARAVAAVRRHDARIAAAHGPRAVWLACSHGDVIKSILADALATPPRQLPADRRRPVLDQRRALHRDAAVRGAGERPGRRRRGLVPPEPKPGEDGGGDVGRASWAEPWGSRRRPRPDGDLRRVGHQPPLRGAGRGCAVYPGWGHVTRHPRLPPARALRRRDRRRARRPLLLPAGHRGRPHGQRAAGEAAGLGARRAHHRAAQEVARRFGSGRPRPSRAIPTPTRSPCRWRRSSGSAPWGWAGTPTPARSSSSCSR